MDEKSKTGLPDGENIPQKKSTTYGQIVKYTGILGGTQALTMAVSLVRNKLATVFLGAVGMGLVALYQSLMAFVANITNLGLAMSAVKHVSDTQEHCSSQETNRYVAMVRTWVLATAVGGTLLCVLLAPVLNYFSFSGKEDHTLDIVFLAPMIGFLAVTGGELALLKAARRLKWIAWASLLCGGLTLLTTIPFYYFFREQGIVAALLCSTFAVMCVYIYYARRVYPWQLLKPSPHLWQQGMGLVRLGMAFIFSSIFASLAEWVIPVAILRHASLEEVAFFKMGFSLMVTYPGMVFVALEADYYPRLSAVHQDLKEMTASVNQQIEVCVMLIAPVLIAFMLALPVVVPLLYTREFLPIVDMAVCAGIYMLFRGVTLPLAYLPLVKSDLKIYLLVELLYNLFFVVLVVSCFVLWGLPGGGLALSLTGLLDMLMLLTLYRMRYGFVLRRSIVGNILVQGGLILATTLLCYLVDSPVRYLPAVLVWLASAVYTFGFLKKNTGLWLRLKNRFRR